MTDMSVRIPDISYSLIYLLFVVPLTVSSPAVTAIKTVDVADIAQNTQMIASSSSDFGGMLFPVFGLVTLGAVILVLAPPLADE